MADRPPVTSRRFTRSELAQLFGNNMRAIVAFEALGLDVSGTLPDAVQAAVATAGEAQLIADGAMLSAVQARDLVAACIAALGDADTTIQAQAGLLAQALERAALLAARIDDLELRPYA